MGADRKYDGARNDIRWRQVCPAGNMGFRNFAVWGYGMGESNHIHTGGPAASAMHFLYELFFTALALLLWLVSVREALGKLTRGRARRIESRHPELAAQMDDWVEHREDYQTILRAGMLLASGVITALVYSLLEATYPAMRHPAVVGLAAAITALIFMVIQFPGRILACRGELLLLRPTMPLLRLLRHTLFHPALALLDFLESRTAGHEESQGDEDRSLAEDEIMSLIEQDEEDGDAESGIEEDERRMIRGIFDLDDTAVREIMTPRVDIVGIPVTASVDEARQRIVESGHSRIPIYENSIDEIKGVLYAKDFLDEDRIRRLSLTEIAHPPLFIPETKTVAKLLEEIRKTRRHFAVLIDEYGGTAGIVTFEDIVEQIVGDIQDEYDTEEDLDPTPQTLPDGTVVFDGRTLIDDVNDALGCRIPDDEDVDTIGGYVCGQLGRIPAVGEELKLPEMGLTMTVQAADGRRIVELKVRRSEGAAP